MATSGLDYLPRLDDAIRAEMARWRIPGLAVGIVHDDRLETAGYGAANVETGFPVLPGTLFQWGSISKMLTATLFMMLVEEKGLDLDAPVVGALPDLRLADGKALARITPRHLLTHTAGFDGNAYDDFGRGDDALGRAVESLATARQWFPPGELWSYTNGGFDILGRVVERLLEIPFETAMRERVLDPLGMTETCYFADEAIEHPVAVGHAPAGDGVEVARPWALPRRANPAGGAIGSAGDLLRFARFHLEGGALDGVRLLSEAATTAMRTPHVAADPCRQWGLGWWLRETGGVRFAAHNGVTNGFTSEVLLVPERGFAMVLLANGEDCHRAIAAIEAAAFDAFLGLPWWEPPPVSLPVSTLQRYAGRYHDGEQEIVLRVDGDGLLVERSVDPPFRLVPVGERSFRAEGAEFAGKYGDVVPGADGEVRFVRFLGLLAERGTDGTIRRRRPTRA